MVQEIIIFILVLFCAVDYKVHAAECSFYSGSVSYVRQCSTGCCESACCTDNFETLAIILGTVFGCVLFLIGLIILLICCTKDRCFQKVSPRKGMKNTDESKPVLIEAGKSEGKRWSQTTCHGKAG
ncbi:uncharacterized protein LOC128190351 [Crassostrea angulata]|uniref:uncharacterized protein LOC128190351 n=1 Tax=Magallana angulata TaxID=2784310 RepID=UPI0022B15822|nr:uncharacterized protein LOC128190351 [Crassostrea angulata]